MEALHNEGTALFSVVNAQHHEHLELLYTAVVKVHAAFESASKQLAQHPTTGLFFLNVSSVRWNLRFSL